MKDVNSKQGFTLIELLIVIAIIGVLAVAFLPSLLGAPAKGRDTARIADLQKIQKVLINGNLEGKAYPTASNCVGDGGAAGLAVTPYLEAFGGKVPVDPNKSPWSIEPKGINDLPGACDTKYAYLYKPTADYSFGLYAKMETASAGNTQCGLIEAANGGGLITKPIADDNSCYAILTQ